VAYTSHPTYLHESPIPLPRSTDPANSYQSYRIAVLCALRFIGYQCDDHGVEVEEEHDQMESEFNETLFLVTIKSTENLRCIQHMMSVQHLVYVPCDERDVKEQRQPIPIHKE